MSKIAKMKVKCPSCGHEAEATVWDSLNTTLDKDMKEKVLSRKIFEFVCPDCGTAANLDYPFLYHQMEDNLMIYYMNNDKALKQIYEMFKNNKQNTFSGDLTDDYRLRIVTSQNRLTEKIRIFDAGYDDRIIEIIKVFLFINFNEEKEIFSVSDMYFSHKDGETGYIEVIDNENKTRTINIPDGFYKEIEGSFGKFLPDNEPLINTEWAAEFLESTK